MQRLIAALFRLLTKPFDKMTGRVVTRLPFSRFFFHPLILEELYMALGMWEPYLRRSFTFGEGSLFVDVGAHIGYHTVYASKKVGKDGLVIAVEPDRRNLVVLYRNIRAIEATNVRVHEAAAGFDGYVFLTPAKNPLFSRTSTIFRHGRKVPSVSLDHLVDRLEETSLQTLVVKIDVEGQELAVVKGGLSFLKTFSPTIIVETDKADELRRILAPLGYTCRSLFGTYFQFCRQKPDCLQVRSP